MKEIVIVDDEPGITTSLAREIKLEFGNDAYAVTTFNDPLLVLPYIKDRQDTVFLAISDLRMPQMNGSELLEKIREQNPFIQTILLTAYTDMDNIQRAVASKIQSLLMKPWKQDALMEEIKKAERLWIESRDNNTLRARMDGLLQSAGDFQEKLFSKNIPPELSGRLTVSSTPFQEYHCGGDFFDFHTLAKGKYLLLVGDVAGHGPKPAIISGIIKTVLETIQEMNPEALSEPASLLEQLNGRFCKIVASTPEVLAALTAVVVDITAGTLSVATAGLPPVIHLRAGKPELIRTPNPVLGAMPSASYYKTERALLPGDCIAILTDGLTESGENRYAVSDETMYTLASAWSDTSAKAIAASFKSILPGKRFMDDATVVSLTVPQ